MLNFLKRLRGIPTVKRKKYGLKPGANLKIVDYGGVLTIAPAFYDPVNQRAGLLKGNDSLTKLIIEEHRQEIELGK